MKITLPSPAVRQWLYGIVTTALPILVVLKVIAPEDVPLWLALSAAVLGTVGGGTAFVAIRSQRKDGTLEQ